MAEARHTSKHQRAREQTENVISETVDQVNGLNREQFQVGERAAQEGVSLFQTNVDLFRHATEMWLSLAGQMAQRSTNECMRAFGSANERAREVRQQSVREQSVGVSAAGTFSSAFNEMSREWMSFLQTRAQHNMDHLNSLINCRTPMDLVAAQRTLVRDNLEDFMQSWRRVSDQSLHLGEEVGREISHTLEENSHAV
jgi:hypothetical protein